MNILYSLYTRLKFSISISVSYICIYIKVKSGLFVCFLRDIRKATWLIVQPTVSRSGREVGLGFREGSDSNATVPKGLFASRRRNPTKGRWYTNQGTSSLGE